jgi:hypothetical protein
MYEVRIKCPTDVLRNAIALMAENGKLQEAVNDYLDDIDADTSQRFDKFADVEFSDEDFSPHLVTLNQI